MKLRTIGHATLLLSDERGAPLLATDPWLLGSCYWRCWWLEDRPDDAALEALRIVSYIYLTHEHPDHFHPPSLRKLGTDPLFLCPDFQLGRMQGYLGQRGARALTLAPRTWYRIGAGVSVMSIPCIGEDSMLLIDTPHAVLINVNDARPTPPQLWSIRRWLRAHAPSKRRIVFSSYSSAGVANSIHRGGRPLAVAGQDAHIRFCGFLCRVLAADLFVPFASHVTHERPDSRWANEHRVRFEDVQARWDVADTELLPPYVEIDLTSGDYRQRRGAGPEADARVQQKVSARLAQEAQLEALDAGDLERLEGKLRAAGRYAFAALFPRGIVFDLGTSRVRYDTLSGRVIPGQSGANLTLRLPAAVLREVLASGHFSDICIPMFTMVEVGEQTPGLLAFAFFTLMGFHDIGWTSSAASGARALARVIRSQLSLLPAPHRAVRIAPGGGQQTRQAVG